MRKTSAAATLAVALGLAAWRAATSEQPSKPKVETSPGRRLPGEVADFEPVVAADAEGQVVVAAIGPLGNNDTGVFLWSSADGGKTFGRPQPALPAPEQPGDRRCQADPCLRTAGPGRFVLSLMGKRTKEAGTNVFVSRSEDGGKTWKSAGEIAAGEFDADRPILAVSPSGRRAALAFVAGGADPLRVLFS